MKNNRAAALRHLHDKLKSGDYDGTDVMAAWIAVEDLACLLESTAHEPGDGWTAVTERLPAFTEDQREFVLVYSETHDWMGTQFSVMRVADFYFYDPDCPEEMGTADADVVTHWKPLTSPALTKAGE
jgi:hypothetical protein